MTVTELVGHYNAASPILASLLFGMVWGMGLGARLACKVIYLVDRMKQGDDDQS